MDEAPDSRHVEQLLRDKEGVTDPDILRSARTAYEQTRRQRSFTVVSPGEIDGVDAALITPYEVPNSPSLNPSSTPLNVTLLSRTDPTDASEPGELRRIRMRCDEPMTSRAARVEALRCALTSEERNRAMPVQAEPIARPGSLFANDKLVKRLVDANVDTLCDAVDLAVAERVSGTAPNPLDSYLIDLFEPEDRTLMSAFHTAFAQTQRVFERRDIARVLQAFRTHLEPAALALGREAGIMDTEFYNTLTGNGNARAGLYRRQALRAYPLLTPCVLRNRLQTDALHNIDQGKPPEKVLHTVLQPATSFKASDGTIQADTMSFSEFRKAIRKLKGVTWIACGRDGVENDTEDTIINCMANVPADWVPDDPTEFASMIRVFSTIDKIWEVSPRDKTALIGETGGQWSAYLARLPDTPVDGVLDMVDQAYRQLAFPAWIRLRESVTSPPNEAALRAQIAEALFGHHGALKILRASERFHRNLPRLDSITAETGGEISWPAPGPSTEVHGGRVQIVPLTARSELLAEGHAMNNCVAGYVDACLNGTHILSVRDRDGRRLATASLKEGKEDDARILVMDQVAGPGNGRPDRTLISAVQAYADWLNEPENAPDFSRLDAEREEIKATWQVESMKATVGFDPHDAQTQERVWQEWRRLTIGPARRAETLTEYMEMTGVADELQRGYFLCYGYELGKPLVPIPKAEQSDCDDLDHDTLPTP